jgi:hypothetical protein
LLCVMVLMMCVILFVGWKCLAEFSA